MKERIELWVFPTGNIAVYRGNAFVPTEQLTEEERLFVLNRVCNELKGKDLDAEIKKYTESLYNETFGNGQSTLDEFDWEDISTVIEDTAKYFHSLRLFWKPTEKQKYDENMDKECVKLCDILNSIPSVNTFESCCGHLKDRFSVWFFCNDTVAISRLGRSVDRNYSDGKWELLVDSTDTHPTGVFWLRSKVPFQSYDEMEESVNELCVGIQYWFNTKFDSYFNGDSCK